EHGALDGEIGLGGAWSLKGRVDGAAIQYDVQDSTLYFDYQELVARLAPRWTHGAASIALGPRLDAIFAPLDPTESYQEIAGAGAVVLAFALRVRSPGSDSSSATALVLDVPSTLEESEPPDRPLVLGPGRRGRVTLYAMVNAIERAAEDDHVGAIVLHIDGIGWGWAKLAEVRDALRRFAAAGKPIYASLSGGGEAEYLLAS